MFGAGFIESCADRTVPITMVERLIAAVGKKTR